MEALIMAGGRGTRMGKCGVEKPLTMIGGKQTVLRVIDAFKGSKYVDKVIVSVSTNTPETEKLLYDMGIETVRTSGGDFVDDLHEAFRMMKGNEIICSPSDLPLLFSFTIDKIIDFYYTVPNDSVMAVVDESVVLNTGIKPSYTFEHDDRNWVISGVSIMDRKKTLDGKILDTAYFMTDWVDLAINVNTKHDVELARAYFTQ